MHDIGLVILAVIAFTGVMGWLGNRRSCPTRPLYDVGPAPVAYDLWQKRLNFDPAAPLWPNRDRFILSSGHASMLLYALLHLTATRAVNSAGEVLGATGRYTGKTRHMSRARRGR